MIRRAILFCLIFSFLYIISVASSGGRASAAGEGNTGAPGDNPKICSSCHFGGNFNPSVTITLTDEIGNEVSAYLPNTKYQVELSIQASNGSPAGYGFQMVSLRDADNSGLSAWSNPSSNAKIASAMGRSYVEHAGVSTSNVFNVDWLAPEHGSGAVSFYAAGNSVNLNGATNGDAAALANLQIQEAISSSLENSIVLSEFNLYPNPVMDFLYIAGFELENKQIELFNSSGLLINKIVCDRSLIQLDLFGEKAGQYFLRITNTKLGTSKVHKIIKL